MLRGIMRMLAVVMCLVQMVLCNDDILRRMEVLEIKCKLQENGVEEANLRQEKVNVELGELRKAIQELTRYNVELRVSNEELRRALQELAGDNIRYGEETTAINERLADLESTVRKATLGPLTTKTLTTDSLNIKLPQTKDKNLTIQTDRLLPKSKREKNKRLVLNESETQIAFFARNDQREVPHLGVNQPIVFENVLFNSGGCYHNNHGTFMAPMNGAYVFSVSILSYVNAHSEVYAELVHNGNRLAIAYGHGDSGRHDQGSVTVIVQLNKGDEVWVRNILNADDEIWGTGMDTFSGFLLWAL